MSISKKKTYQTNYFHFIDFLYVTILVVLKFSLLLPIARQFKRGNEVLHAYDRLPAILSTFLLNVDLKMVYVVFVLLILPLSLPLAVFPEGLQSNYLEQRVNFHVRLGIRVCFLQRARRIFLKTFLLVLSLFVIDFALSFIFWPARSLGTFYDFGDTFINNAMIVYQSNWAVMPYPIVVFYGLFSVQTALMYAVLLTGTYAVSYVKSLDYRLFNLLPFLLITSLSLITEVLAYLLRDSKLFLSKLMTHLQPLNLIAFTAKGKSMWPCTLPLAIYLVVFTLLMILTVRKLRDKGQPL